MGLLDKAKRQAVELKGKVEGKVDDVQQKRKTSDLFEELGRLTYAERIGRPVLAGEIERFVGELRALEESASSSDDSEPTATGGAAESG